MKKDLYDLIKSLTPSEKKAVRQHAFTYKKQGDNILQQLFTLIDKQPVYNETVLKAEIPNLSNRKHELWNKIMLVLQMHETQIQQVTARRKLDFTHILINKQLFKQAGAMAIEAEQWSTENEHPYIKGMALQYQSALLQQHHNATLYEHARELRKQLIKNAEETTVMVKAFDFYMRVSQADNTSNFIRDPRAQQSIKKFLTDEYSNLPLDKMGLMAACMYTDAQSTVYYVLRDYSKAFLIDKQMQQYFKAYTHKTTFYQMAYRSFLINRMNLLERVGANKEWLQSLREYKQIIDTVYPNDVLCLAAYYVTWFWYHYKTDKFKSSPQVITETEDFYNRFHSSEIEQTFLRLQWDFIVAFFDLGQLDKAWHYCGSFVNNPLADVMADVKEFMRLFFLFIILEKKDWHYLMVRVKQYQRAIQNKDKTLYAFDHLTLSFMKKMHTSKNNRKQQRNHLEKFLNQINRLYRANHLHTHEVLDAYDFRIWIKQKLTATAF